MIKQEKRYPNGNLKEITEVNTNQEPQKRVTLYHPNGKEEVSVLFNNGQQMQGTVNSYDINGNKIRMADINEVGQFDGLVVNYWTNGNIKQELLYQNDRLIDKVRNWDYFGNEISCIDVEEIIPEGINIKNKTNYYISIKEYQKEIVFNQFLEELENDFQYERLATEYSIRKQYGSTEDAIEVIKKFNSKFDFNRVPGELEIYRKGDYEIVQVENNIILAFLPFFHIKASNWGINEYSKEFVKLNWIQGIGLVYKESDLLEYPDVQEEIKWNIPYHTYHNNGIEIITIRCKSKSIAEYLVDQIILVNGGFDYFKNIVDQEILRDSEYAFKGPLFVIFISESDIVINRIKSQISYDTSIKEGISEFSDVINASIPGLNRLIYNEGEGYVKDGRFWINSAGTMISSLIPDYEEACSLYLNMIRKHHPENRDLELPIEKMVNAKSRKFEIKKEDFWIILSQGVDVKHFNIMLFNDKFKTYKPIVPDYQQSRQEVRNTKSIIVKENIEDPKIKERKHLDHMVFCSGYFTVKTKDGVEYEINAQKHHLREFYQEWNSETKEWEDWGEEEYLDEFYLTENEDGFRFSEKDVERYFGSIYDYNWDGLSNNWSGIDSVTPETVEESKKKWEVYKNRFPKIKSKEQFKYNIITENP